MKYLPRNPLSKRNIARKRVLARRTAELYEAVSCAYFNNGLMKEVDRQVDSGKLTDGFHSVENLVDGSTMIAMEGQGMGPILSMDATQAEATANNAFEFHSWATAKYGIQFFCSTQWLKRNYEKARDLAKKTLG